MSEYTTGGKNGWLIWRHVLRPAPAGVPPRSCCSRIASVAVRDKSASNADFALRVVDGCNALPFPAASFTASAKYTASTACSGKPDA